MNKTDVLGRWGERAYELLRAIPAPEARKKRTTLLAIADAVIVGRSLVSVFEQPNTCSRTIHYNKWMHQPEYRAAYDWLVGNDDAPGLARKEAEAAELREYERATTQIATARHELQMASLPAVRRMVAALDAENGVYYEGGKIADEPAHAVRLKAASEIADRIPELAKVASGRDGGAPADLVMPAFDPNDIDDDDLLKHLRALGRASLTIANGEPIATDENGVAATDTR